MQLSNKQAQFVTQAHRRWNIKSGATRSGKTFLDYYIIPMRMLERKGLDGLTVFIGNTKGTLQRNIIEPLQNIYGTKRVSSIRADNTATIFGERVHCLGADTKKHVDRLRGTSIKYCYGDEVVTWEEEVFTMLKSRLDREYSIFDGTCNPESPNHWFKRFLDSDADIFQQAYTIDDNPFLAQNVRDALKAEYAGTVFYDRYILGRWVAAEGAIYQQFAADPKRFYGIPEPNEIKYAFVGVDFGGNGSAHAFSLLGVDAKMQRLYVLDEYYRKEIITPNELEADFVAFVRYASERYKLAGIYADSAEQVLIRGLNTALLRSGVRGEARNARKGAINDRIRFFLRLMGADRFRINPSCVHTVEALRTAVWDAKHKTDDVRLDDGIQNIDSLDAMEYAVERIMKDMIR